MSASEILSPHWRQRSTPGGAVEPVIPEVVFPSAGIAACGREASAVTPLESSHRNASSLIPLDLGAAQLQRSVYKAPLLGGLLRKFFNGLFPCAPPLLCFFG